jgi:2-polyprenyl-3-methyl-5-hydroxy-6-metoxy-1,4-benzoquinol methylase
MSKQREFPDWEQLYQDKDVESMPWFNAQLDPDLEKALTTLNIHAGAALDLGTGPATQAIALAERGFQVTATDLSNTAIRKASAKATEKGLNIDFQQDDIFNTHLNREFDFVFDRGCFHVFQPQQRPDYVRVVARLVKPKGYLLLKTFSHLEPREDGPYRFTPEEIAEIFSTQFHVVSFTETVYHGTLNPLPRALFSILQK